MVWNRQPLAANTTPGLDDSKTRSTPTINAFPGAETVTNCRDGRTVVEEIEVVIEVVIEEVVRAVPPVVVVVPLLFLLDTLMFQHDPCLQLWMK